MSTPGGVPGGRGYMSQYSTKAIEDLWGDETTLYLWSLIERRVLEAQHDANILPYDVDLEVPPPSVEEWREATALCGHEVVAFLDLWAKRGMTHCHVGLTSSDLVDTALGWRVLWSATHIGGALINVSNHLEGWAKTHHSTRRLGRTHGQAAAPSNLGHVFEVFAAAFLRAELNLRRATRDAAVCKISGPVGIPSEVLPPSIEARVADKLGLRPAGPSTQIAFRDRLARWALELVVIATLVEAVAMEIRLMCHSQVGEARDGGGSTSSAMSHKRNPNRAERLCGLGRMARAAAAPLTEGIVQWHERDLAHSSVERVLLPQLVGSIHYSLRLLDDILGDLRFDDGAMALNLSEHGSLIQSHALQTRYQVNGLGYLDARDRTRRLLAENLSPGALRLAIQQDPHLFGYLSH